MNREDLRDYGLSLGIEYAGLRDWALGQTVKFMHDRYTDTISIKTYKRGIYLVDEGDHWIADDAFFRSRSLDDAEARQLLADWLGSNVNHLEYCDPAYLPYCDPNYQG
jgi:hypothetical protein